MACPELDLFAWRHLVGSLNGGTGVPYLANRRTLTFVGFFFGVSVKKVQLFLALVIGEERI